MRYMVMIVRQPPPLRGTSSAVRPRSTVLMQPFVEREEFAQGDPERRPAHHLDRHEIPPAARRQWDEAAPGEERQDQGGRERDDGERRATHDPGEACGAEVLVDHPEQAGDAEEDRPPEQETQPRPGLVRTEGRGQAERAGREGRDPDEAVRRQ